MKPIKGWKRGQPLPDLRDPKADREVGKKFVKALGKGLSDPEKYNRDNTKYGKVKPSVSHPTKPLPSKKKMERYQGAEEVLSEDGSLPIGTIHTWKDGKDYQKTRQGWIEVPSRNGSGGAKQPEGDSPQAQASAQEPAAKKGSEPAAEPSAKKATKDNLPEEPWKYFNKGDDTELADVSKLKTVRTRPTGVESTAELMANAYNGEGSKRDPVSVKKEPDGTYSVVDGSAAVAAAQANKWSKIPVKVVQSDAAKEAPKEEPQENGLLPPVMPETGTWTDSAPGLPKDTMEHYTKNGEWAPERKPLHDRIKKAFLDAVKPTPPDQKPVAVLMMGGPASGKSSIAGGISESDFVKVDADEIKGQIPEYREAVKKRARNAAMMAHEESSYLSKQVRDAAIKERKNVLIDGTGKNAKSYGELVQRLKKEGYHVRLMMPDIDVETAVSRASDRADKIGRYVPEEFIREAYQVIPKNFMKIAKDCDEAALFDTRRKPPFMVWSKADGAEKEHDPEFMKKFNADNAMESVMDEARKSKGKKPSLDFHKTVDRALKGYEREQEKLAKMPKKFKKGMGVRMPKPDDKSIEE